MTTLLEKADTTYKEIKERRHRLREEEIKERSRLAELHAQGNSDWTDKQCEISARLRAIAEERQPLEGSYLIAKRKAQNKVFTQITSSAAYQRTVSEAVLALAEALPRWQALDAIITEARRNGVTVPVSLARLLAEAKLWVTWMIAARALNVAELPLAVQDLLEGSHHE
jgi:hypothetical protein